MLIEDGRTLDEAAMKSGMSGLTARRYRRPGGNSLSDAGGLFGDTPGLDRDDWRHNSKEYDGNTGLVYMYQRWYLPETGTFVSKAPYEPMVEHGYTFARSNPLNRIDPKGEYDDSLHDDFVECTNVCTREVMDALRVCEDIADGISDGICDQLVGPNSPSHATCVAGIDGLINIAGGIPLGLAAALVAGNCYALCAAFIYGVTPAH